MLTRTQKFLNFQRDQGGILNPTSAAEYLDVSRTWLQQLRHLKKVEAVRVNGTFYYGMASLRILKSINQGGADLGPTEAKYTC